MCRMDFLTSAVAAGATFRHSRCGKEGEEGDDGFEQYFLFRIVCFEI